MQESRDEMAADKKHEQVKGSTALADRGQRLRPWGRGLDELPLAGSKWINEPRWVTQTRPVIGWKVSQWRLVGGGREVN